jgi:aryl-alcohol dehydrogenase-like predicted oxidoreductase
VRYRSIGTTDLRVSEVGLGLEAATAGDRTDDEVVALLWRALDLGIAFFDTADADGHGGRGEKLLGRAVRGRRDEVTVATKFGWDLEAPQRLGGPSQPVQDWSTAYASRALDRSLGRLGLEPVDLWQLHHPGLDAVESEELFAFLDEQVVKGKIRAYGVALGPGTGWADEGVAALRERRVATVQAVYSLLEPEPGRELAQVAEETGAGLFARLTPPPAPAGTGPGAGRPGPPGGRQAALLERLEFLTRDRGQTLGQASCRFVLGTPGVAAVLPDIDDEERLVEYATASDLPDLTQEDAERVVEAHEAGPGPRTGADR